MPRSVRGATIPVVLAASLLLLGTAGGALAGSMITGAQIKNGTVTGLDVRNGSLGPADLSSTAKRQLEPATVPSGTTVRGVWTASGDYPENGTPLDVGISLPVPAPEIIPLANVLIDDGPDAEACRGTASSPSAPRGKVCVYGTKNATVSSIQPASTGAVGQEASRYGFYFTVQGTGAYANVTMSGTWAYTAP